VSPANPQGAKLRGPALSSVPTACTPGVRMAPLDGVAAESADVPVENQALR